MAAAEAEELIPSNPVRKTRFPRRGSGKERAVIAPEKIRDLLDALPEPSSSLAHCLYSLGYGSANCWLCAGETLIWRHGLARDSKVYEGHFDEPKSQRSKRSVPLGAKSIEILSARKPAGMNPEALVFSTGTGTPFDRHNLSQRQLKPTCKSWG